MYRPRRFLAGAIAVASLSLTSSFASADVPPQRTFFRLASSNGFGAVMLDLSAGRATHFREHLFAREEPLVDASGMQQWSNGQPLVVHSRDLLYDAYFGVRANGNQQWLAPIPVDLDKSGYAAWQSGKTAGTGVATMVQYVAGLEATTFFFAPRSLPHAGFVMALRLKNTSNATVKGVSAFSIHNLHLGYGRPGVMQVVAANGETIGFDGSNGHADFLERGFAGVVVGRALGAVAHHGASPGADVYGIVNGGGSSDLPDLNGEAPTHDDSVSAFQSTGSDLAPGDETWFGVAFARDGDPFGGAKVQGWLDTYVAGAGAKALVDAEIASWAALQSSLVVPKSLSADEETVLRQQAVMLAMAQDQEDTTYLREFLTQDGEPRYSRFSSMLPGDVKHKGKGAVIASLPPGEWTVAWARDSAYSVSAMASLGMKDQAKDALLYALDADAGLFQSWNELKPYNMPPYQVSLVRYFGFGVEETDFNDFGPNLEFDGFGLFLWALRHYEVATKDTSVADAAWTTVSTKIADPLVALVDPASGLLYPDSSVWETHWNGRQRAWAFTNITAARGLCDAADIADRRGDAAAAKKYRDAGKALRAAIATKLTDGMHAIASNTDELAEGEGYWDAAVLDAIAMGLFDPKGMIAQATYAGIDAHLATQAGAGWSRNDDKTDHANGNDTSPWGSDYDSAEWVFTDLRGAVAARRMGDAKRSDRILTWVRQQAMTNYLAMSETYDENAGTYKFNAPMIGFGAGVYALALADRDAPFDAPACGAYFEGGSSSSSSSGGGAGGAGAGGGGAGGAPSTSSSSSSTSGFVSTGAGGSKSQPSANGGCGCELDGDADPRAWSTLLAGSVALAIARLRRRRAAR